MKKHVDIDLFKGVRRCFIAASKDNLKYKKLLKECATFLYEWGIVLDKKPQKQALKLVNKCLKAIGGDNEKSHN